MPVKYTDNHDPDRTGPDEATLQEWVDEAARYRACGPVDLDDEPDPGPDDGWRTYGGWW